MSITYYDPISSCVLSYHCYDHFKNDQIIRGPSSFFFFFFFFFQLPDADVADHPLSGHPALPGLGFSQLVVVGELCRMTDGTQKASRGICPWTCTARRPLIPTKNSIR